MKPTNTRAPRRGGDRDRVLRRSRRVTRRGPRLLRLTIEDYVLIARAEATFDEGFTVFTGETGSGKSMRDTAL